MTNVNTQFTNFNGGEISPKVYGRPDLQAYYNGCRRLEGFICQTQGAAVFRAGFQFISETKDGNRAFVYQFQFSDEQAYILEFTDLNIRIYKDRGLLLDSGSPVDVTVPYLESEIFSLKFAQTSTDLYITHPNHAPRKLTRDATTETTWSVSTHAPTGLTFGTDDNPAAVGFYEDRLIYGGTNNDPQTLFFSESANPDDFTIGTGATDGIQYTVSSGESSNKIEWIKGTQDFLAIGGFGDILKATGGQGEEAIAPNQISIKPTNTVGSADINPVGGDQYVAFVERDQRTLRTLELLTLEGIYRPVDRNIASDHITETGITDIAFQKGRPSVVWCTRTDGVLLGLTLERDQEVSGWHRHPRNGEFVSVATVPRVKDYSDLYACVKVGDTYHIEYMNDLFSYPKREDFVGTNKDDDTQTWQRAMFEAQKKYIHLDSALTFDGAARPLGVGANLSVGSVTGSNVLFTSDQAVFTINDVGEQIRVKSVDGTKYGRALITSFTSTTIVECEILVEFDSLSYDDWYITASSVSGLDHLEGMTVGVVADGAVHPDRVVDSGSIDLESSSSVVHVGLKYSGTIISNDLEGGGTTGTAQTKKKNLYKIGFRFLETLGVSFGTNAYNLEDRLNREAVNLMDNPPPLFTGDEVLRFHDGDGNSWSRSKRIIVQQDLPVPATVQLVIPYFTVSNVD